MAIESPPDADQQPKSGDPDQVQAAGSDKVRAPIKLFEKRSLTTTVVGAAVLATLRTLTRLGRSKSKVAAAESGSSDDEPDAVASESVGASQGEASSENAHGGAAPADGTGQTDHLNQSLTERRADVRLGGGQKRIDAQHSRGKLTARERIDRILDTGSFEEIAPHLQHRHSALGLDKQRYAGDGVVTGFGLIEGRRVAIFAQDFTVLGGSFSEAQAIKVGRLLELATSGGLPILALLDSVGARIQEGVWSLAGFGDLFWRNTQASGVVPQISMMLGPCAGGAVYFPDSQTSSS